MNNRGYKSTGGYQNMGGYQNNNRNTGVYQPPNKNVAFKEMTPDMQPARELSTKEMLQLLLKKSDEQEEYQAATSATIRNLDTQMS